MQLLAIAGGAGPGGEDVLGCCGFCPLLPVVLLLTGRAVYRGSAWPALLALALSGLPCLLLWGVVAGYQPSDDGDVVADQESGRQTLAFYAGLSAAAGAAAVLVGVRRLVGRQRSDAEPGAAADAAPKAGPRC